MALALAALLVIVVGGTASAGQVADPRFAPPKNYDNPGKGSPTEIVRGDFDEDAVADLVLGVNSSQRHLSLFRGNRDGTFDQPRRRFGLVRRPLMVLLRSDLNGDGHLDLAFSAGESLSSAGSVVVLTGRGDGTFKKPKTFPSGGNAPIGLVAVDVDGDGDKDLAVANTVSGASNDRDGNVTVPQDGNVTVLRNNGRGAFKPGQTIEPPSPPSSRVSPVFLAARDLDGDGDPDLAATAVISTQAGDTGKVLVLKNEKGRYVQGQSVAVGAEPQEIIISRLNGDRKPDLATANAFSNNVSVCLGRGDGTFRNAEEFSSGGPGSSSLTAADFNGDGKKDLAVANPGPPPPSPNVGVLTGKGDGTFKKPETFEAGKRPAGIVKGWFDRDRRPDLAVANGLSKNLSVLINTTPR